MSTDLLPLRELIEAAEALVARWYSPKWKDETHTAEFIERLRRAALAQKEAAAPAHDPGPTCVYCAVAIDGAAHGDLYAAIMAIPLPDFDHSGRDGCAYVAYSYEAMEVFRHSAARIARAALAQPVAVDAPRARQSEAAARLLKAAKTYSMKYVQDEAEPEDDPSDLVCSPEQHVHAVELFAAIKEADDAAIDAQDGEATT